jgi:FAD/FMN-containing dehydrogenase
MYHRHNSEYPRAREATVWNGVVPDRFPDAIARPSDREEVPGLVDAALADGRRIAIKSGGHNWRGAFLRDGGLLLDFGDLKGIEIDPERMVAAVGPGATHKVLADALVPHGLGFPIGHCPSVGLGGYLLAGGYGWNPRIWGPACWSVTAVDVIAMDGRELVIDESSEPDLFWAARGGGGGFPAIATRFHVRLQSLPKIASVRADYPLERLPELLAWSAGQLEMPRGTEISLIAHRGQDDTGVAKEVATTQSSGFAESGATARQLAVDAAAAPCADARLDRREIPDVALNDLEGEGAWTEGRRHAVDMCWVDGSYEEVGAVCELAIREAPSDSSRIVLAWGFAPESGPDVAQTANGTLTVNLYGIWDDPGDDAVNEAWVRATMGRLEPWTTGFYAGEADLGVAPDRPRRCYPPEKWERLSEIRERFDPERRKYGFLSEP